jgi:hypothetical protein
MPSLPIKGSSSKNFAGQEMMAYAPPEMRHSLYYWQREARNSEAEIDYLSVLQGEIIPVDVKSGSGSSLRSLHSFLAAHPKSPYGIKLSTEPRSRFEKIQSIPLYAAFELVEGGTERVQSLLSNA